MAEFGELRRTDLKKINGLTRRMVRCDDLAQLETTFVSGVTKCLPVDQVAWKMFDRKGREDPSAEFVGTYGNVNLSINYHRLHPNFTQRERAILHLLNRRLDTIAGALHRQNILQARLNALCQLPKSGQQAYSQLTTGEVRALASFMRGEKVPRDTVARVRQKTGVKTSKQLVGWVAVSMGSCS